MLEVFSDLKESASEFKRIALKLKGRIEETSLEAKFFL